MQPVSAADFEKPMAEMNMTPLIDVMLVLLVMLIMTIPPQTHAVKFDLPDPSPVRLQPPNPLHNELAITDAGLLMWNGVPISRPALRGELALTQQMQPTPELHLRPAAHARYGTVDEILALIKSEHVQKVGFVGNEAYLNV